MAVWYAYGPKEMGECKPASAFSKGDVLVYTSASSLSRLPEPVTSAASIAGVATCDSTQSVRNLVTFIKVNSDTVFWSHATPGSSYTVGAAVNFNYGALTNGTGANGSTGTVLARAERAIADIEGQSVQSRVLVRFIGHGGRLEHGS